MGQRNFNPRKIIPKDRLLKHLQDGLTMQEIGDKYNVGRSYISELCSLHGIDADNIDGRKDKMRMRKNAKERKSFVDILYERAKKEVG